jgi:hypothetical protein
VDALIAIKNGSSLISSSSIVPFTTSAASTPCKLNPYLQPATSQHAKYTLIATAVNDSCFAAAIVAQPYGTLAVATDPSNAVNDDKHGCKP